MVIGSATNIIYISAPHLQHLLSTIWLQLEAFEFTSFAHVFHELNSEAEGLSKFALALEPDMLETQEIKDGKATSIVQIT